MNIQLPKLYFRKIHKTTKAEFVDHFDDRNCSQWSLTKLCDLHIRANERVNYWNGRMSDWHYEVIGWNIEGLDV